jgi:uncharacterized protein (DUF1330 family)
MAHILVHIKVSDQAKWKDGFSAAADLRKKFGSKGVRAFAKADDPNDIYILGEYADLEQARQLFQTQEFRDAAQKAGVSGPPEIVSLSHLLDLSA